MGSSSRETGRKFTRPRAGAWAFITHGSQVALVGGGTHRGPQPDSPPDLSWWSLFPSLNCQVYPFLLLCGLSVSNGFMLQSP